jgi:hypothetical protein
VTCKTCQVWGSGWLNGWLLQLDTVRARAERWASLAHRDLPDALTDILELVLTPAHTAPDLDKPITSLPDHEVLAFCFTLFAATACACGWTTGYSLTNGTTKPASTARTSP